MFSATLGYMYTMMLIFIPEFAIFSNTLSTLVSWAGSGLLRQKNGEIIQPVIYTYLLADSSASWTSAK